MGLIIAAMYLATFLVLVLVPITLATALIGLTDWQTFYTTLGVAILGFLSMLALRAISGE